MKLLKRVFGGQKYFIRPYSTFVFEVFDMNTPTTLLAFLTSALSDPATKLDISLRYEKGEWNGQRTAETDSLFSLRGMTLIREAATDGNADAQNALGRAYWYGGRGGDATY